LVEDVGDVGEVVGGGDGGEEAGAGAALGGGEGAGGGQRGLCGRGVEPAGVKAQPTMPTDNGAVEPVRVAAGVKEAEPERVGERELGELTGGGGGQGCRRA